jgi:hypothetical protein
MGILWALGRDAPIDPERCLLHLNYLRTAFDWLDRYGPRLVALVAQELT